MLTRHELYDLIWSEPARTLAPRFGISDVALSKLCEKHEIPQPPRGYWAKRAAGKPVPKFPLPPRRLGIREIIKPGQWDHWSYYNAPRDLIETDLGEPPSFTPPVEDLIAEVRRQVGKVTIPRDLTRAHHNIQTLLTEDDKRRATYLAKSYRSAWDAPFFDSPFEKRRLRIMNALMVSLAKHGCKPSLSRKKDPEQIDYKVGHEVMAVKVDEPGYQRSSWRTDKDLAKPASTILKISIELKTEVLQTEWQDKNDGKIEDHIVDIVVMALVAGEVSYRQREVSHHKWLVEHKARRIEEEKRTKAERERRERERLEAERKARVDGLLHDAALHRQANDIRDYVAAVRAAGTAAVPERLDLWARWALEQADDLDPLIGFNFEGGADS